MREERLILTHQEFLASIERKKALDAQLTTLRDQKTTIHARLKRYKDILVKAIKGGKKRLILLFFLNSW